MDVKILADKMMEHFNSFKVDAPSGLIFGLDYLMELFNAQDSKIKQAIAELEKQNKIKGIWDYGTDPETTTVKIGFLKIKNSYPGLAGAKLKIEKEEFIKIFNEILEDEKFLSSIDTVKELIIEIIKRSKIKKINYNTVKTYIKAYGLDDEFLYLKDRCEINIVKGAMNGEKNPVMAKLNLTNNFGETWKEKIENHNIHSGEGVTINIVKKNKKED